jgi:integrase
MWCTACSILRRIARVNNLKHPLLRKDWPRIRDLGPATKKRYMVDARPSPGRQYFPRIGDARTLADQLATERANRGAESLNFSTENRMLAVQCLEQLRPFGKTLTDATNHYVGWLRSEDAKRKTLLVSECIERYLATRQADFERDELSRLSLYEIQARAKQVSAALGGIHIAEFDGAKVKTYLDSFPVTARTRVNIRLRLSRFFAFCVSEGWIERNPCEKIKLRAKRSDTRILTIEAAKDLLTKAQASEFAAAVAVPYVALGLFGGLRPGEAEQLDWGQVDFATKSIEVLGSTSKGRETRHVHMEPTLIKWLRPYAKKSGLVVGPNFRKNFETVKRACGYDPKAKATRWVQDILRHSFASYWLPIHKNRNALAEEMGNSVEVIKDHYRKPIHKAVATKYWALVPKG